jgi:hypothetical protein
MIVLRPIYNYFTFAFFFHRTSSEESGAATFLPSPPKDILRNDDLACLTIMMRILSSERLRPEDPGPARDRSLCKR